MNLVAWLVAGAAIGWVANKVMKAEHPRGLATSIVVGVAGALLGGWLVSPLFGAADDDQAFFSLIGLTVAAGVAVALLALTSLFRREVAS